MSLSTSFRSDSGSAIVDLVGFGILLQIPILMFATLAVQSQQQSFAIESIARHALRSFVLWPERENMQAVVVQIANDFGLSAERITWKLHCSPDPTCLAPRTVASIEVRMGGLVAHATQRL